MHDLVISAARACGPIPPGSYRVITVPPDGDPGHHDFPTFADALQYADDIASESDYPPTLAYVIDSDFRQVERGMHYAVRKPPLKP